MGGCGRLVSRCICVRARVCIAPQARVLAGGVRKARRKQTKTFPFKVIFVQLQFLPFRSLLSPVGLFQCLQSGRRLARRLRDHAVCIACQHERSLNIKACR